MNKLKIKGGNNAIPEAFRQSFQAHEEPIPPEEGYRSTDMEVILDHLGTLLVQTAACVLQLRDAFSELALEELDDTEALADGEEEDDHEVLILTPSGYAEIAFSQECKERFDWFNKVSVFEPVPDCDNLFITCDPNSMKTLGDKKYIIGPCAVIYMEDEPEQEGTVTFEDVTSVMSALANRYGFLVDAATGEKTKAICIS